MSTLIFRFEGDGHKPRVSPKGNLVAWGNTSLRVVDVANPAEIWPVGEGRALRFLDNDHIAWVKPTSNFTADLYWDDLRFFSGGIKDVIADPSLVAGNDFEASNAHWASVLVSDRRLTFDYQRKDVIAFAVRMRGDYMLTVEEISGSRYFVVYFKGVRQRVHSIPSNANEFLISEKGWITYGYFGPTHVITTDGKTHSINVVKDESIARIVHLPNGETWAWTSTVLTGGEPFVLGRPLVYLDGTDTLVTNKSCVQLPFPAEGVDAQWWDERQSFTIAGAANLGHHARLDVHVVPVNHPRSKVEDTPVEPPKDEQMNTPGITVLDYAKTIQNGVNTQIVHWKDRNNSGCEFIVRIENGSLKVEMTYDGWQTKKDYTGSSRPVTIKG